MKLEDLQTVFSSLNQTDAQFLVVGGLATVLHGSVRLTVDLDLVIELDTGNILRAFDALEPLGYTPRVPVTAQQFADPELRDSWIQNKGMMVLNLRSNEHPETPIDIFVSSPFPFKEVYEKSSKETLADGTSFHFVDVNTLIAMKQKAGRPKDLVDIEHLKMISDMEES
jgi:hypothetical protein